MNHDAELKSLSSELQNVLSKYIDEIAIIKDPKHRIALIQEFEKAQHYMLKMSQCLDAMNCWFTAFGADGNANKQ